MRIAFLSYAFPPDTGGGGIGTYLRHIVPAQRLELSYLRRIAYQTGVSWAEFCARHGFKTPIPRWTAPLRQARAFVRLRAWSGSGFISWATTAGRIAGRATPSQHS